MAESRALLGDWTGCKQSRMTIIPVTSSLSKTFHSIVIDLSSYGSLMRVADGVL